jgi:hypothetical protein
MFPVVGIFKGTLFLFRFTSFYQVNLFKQVLFTLDVHVASLQEAAETAISIERTVH